MGPAIECEFTGFNDQKIYSATIDIIQDYWVMIHLSLCFLSSYLCHWE